MEDELKMATLFQCLSLYPWMKRPSHVEEVVSHQSENYWKIRPIFNRPGMYYDRRDNNAWFETPDGGAYWMPPEDFINKLKMLNVGELTQKQEDALKNIVDARLATSDQLGMYRARMFWKELERTRRDARKLRLGVNKILRAKIQERKNTG